MTVLEILIEACEASERDAQRVADQLDRWAQASIDGGWSTHQVDAMRRLARDLRADDKRRMAAELGRAALARAAMRTVLPAGPMPDCDG